MGCRILVGTDDDGNGGERACFYCSVTDTVFGELMNDLEEAQSFQKYCNCDLRVFTKEQFSQKLNEFREKREPEVKNE